MKPLLAVLLAGLLLACQSCATARLWEDINPNERIWVGADKISEQTLRQKGISYEVYTSGSIRGFLIPKSGMQKMKDYQLRALGTPVTLVLDAATTVVVVGAYMFIHDPDGTVSLIRALSH